jgi:hypothetical protein
VTAELEQPAQHRREQATRRAAQKQPTRRPELQGQPGREPVTELDVREYARRAIVQVAALIVTDHQRRAGGRAQFEMFRRAVGARAGGTERGAGASDEQAAPDGISYSCSHWLRAVALRHRCTPFGRESNGRAFISGSRQIRVSTR